MFRKGKREDEGERREMMKFVKLNNLAWEFFWRKRQFYLVWKIFRFFLVLPHISKLHPS
jgi:DNA primase catalytic subunit